jgi:ketosteroid isomerase-like protein
MSDVEEHARAAVDAFQDAFNAQDHERLAAALNYPHVRLWSGVFRQIDTPEEFAEISRRGQARLESEGWHHTTTASMEVVQAGPDKAHCALVNHRTHADGTVYHKFNTLWIITNQNGHWGVKFRSSFLGSDSH